MNVKMNGKIICCLIAVIVLFLGISTEVSVADSSFSRATNETSTTGQMIRSSEVVMEEAPVCTISMLQSGTKLIRSNMMNAMNRWQSRAMILFVVVGSILQFLFYQSAESKEDGQLFLCRSVIVNYIHQKDNGK